MVLLELVFDHSLDAFCYRAAQKRASTTRQTVELLKRQVD